jgi:hypothetical protein
MISPWGQKIANGSSVTELMGRIFGDETTVICKVSNSLSYLYTSRAHVLSHLVSESRIN